MKLTFLLVTLVIFCATASAAPRATVVIRPQSTVSGDSFDLADIATVTSTDTAFRLQLMSATMGRSPMPGLSRPFEIGNVTLKLRQAGIDPETVAFSGATDMTIYGTDGAQPTAQPQVGTPASPVAGGGVAVASGQPKQLLIHSGDTVMLVYDADGMAITATVVATTSGGVGDTINLRRDGAIRLLSGVIQDAQTVRMVE